MSQTPRADGKQFIAFIHLLRGIAPLMVMWSHLAGLWLYVSKTTWAPWTFFYDHVMLPFHVYQGFGHLGVILFFLISGYVISFVGEREERLEFAVKRVLRIIPPLIVAVIVLAIANMLLAKNGHALIHGTNSTEFKDYALTATLLDRFVYSTSYSLSVTWTLVTEFWFYGFVLLLLPLIKRSPVKATVGILGLFAILSAPMVVVPYFQIASANTVYIPIFVVGRVIFLLDAKKISTEQAWLICSAALLMFFAVSETRQPGEMFAGPIIKAFTYPTAILVFLGLRSMNISKIPSVFNFLGNISYSLYLLHLPLGLFTISMLTERTGFSVAFAVATCVTISASWVSYRFIEKPSQRLARMVCARLKRPSIEQHVS